MKLDLKNKSTKYRMFGTRKTRCRNGGEKESILGGHDEHRVDLAHYWSRLMWYRDELWRITTPVWAVYGAFVATCIGYIWSSDKGKISGDIPMMLEIGVVSFSYVIHRMYWTYSSRVYSAINELNKEVQQREQYIYDHFLKNGRESDYGRFKVYPQLNVIFLIVGLTMMFACMFTIAASAGFVLVSPSVFKTDSISPPLMMFMVCFGLIIVFEFMLKTYEK